MPYSEERFLSSLQLKDAVVRRIEVIGEAVKNLDAELKDNYPAVPWKRIAGMRDTLIHEYFGVDLKLTWKVAGEDIPELKKKLLDIQRALDNPSP